VIVDAGDALFTPVMASNCAILRATKFSRRYIRKFKLISACFLATDGSFVSGRAFRRIEQSPIDGRQ
jgi:hypothetical protein